MNIQRATLWVVLAAAGAAWSEQGPRMGDRGFLEHEGERIYYETYGEGDAVVFSHGFGGNHAIWYQQVHPFAKHYRVVTWDHRGFGQSTNVNDDAGPASSARDLGALLDHLQIERAHLIGQSMGGWTVMGFAKDHPNRVRSIVMADTIGGIYTPEIEEAFDAYIRSRFSAPVRGALPFGGHPAIGAKHVAENPTHAFLYEQIGSATSPPPVTIPRLLRTTSYDHKKIRALDAPVLFVVGSDDDIFPPHAVRAAAEIAEGTVVEIAGAGHSPYFETPDRWNRTVLEFLEGVDSGR